MAIYPTISEVPPPFRLGYHPALNGLRGVAVLAVMIYHTGTRYFHGGGIGVDIFFVLSGFLITALLLQEHDRSGRIDLKAFYLRRILRLWPAFWTLMIGYGVTVALMAPDPRKHFEDMAIAALNVSNWSRAMGTHRPDFLGHTWSLSIEEQFYLLWPLLLVTLVVRAKVSRIGLLRGLIAAAALSAAARVVLFLTGSSEERVYNGLDTRADALLIGCACAVLLSLRGPQDFRIRHRGMLSGIIALLIGISFATLYQSPTMILAGYAVVALCAAAIILHLIGNPQGRLARFLSWPVLVWMGQISYGLYLWHYPVYRILYGWVGIHSSPLLLICGGAVSFLFAAASFYLVEGRFLRVKERLSRHGNPPSETTPAASPETSEGVLPGAEKSELAWDRSGGAV